MTWVSAFLFSSNIWNGNIEYDVAFTQLLLEINLKASPISISNVFHKEAKPVVNGSLKSSRQKQNLMLNDLLKM